MTRLSRFARLRRSLAFARHIPPAQLLRRAALSLRRAYRDRFGWPAPSGAPPALSDAPPSPLFAPRAGMIDGLAFTFVGRTHIMSGAIDWNAPSLAPEHQLWRMNLHYMEYLEEVDDLCFIALIDDWIAANPPGRRGAWKDSWNSYALSLRSVVWMQQFARRHLSPDALPGIVASLAAQVEFLEVNLETDIDGNHLVKNIKALLWAAAFFRGPDAERWRRSGLRLLRFALREQILPDGVHYERSPSYHAQVFADLLECRHVLPAPPHELDDALRTMAAATADLAHPDGGAAQFNDAGLHMAYPPADCLDVFATMFGERPAPRVSFGFPAAGYFGRRVGEDYFVADCGRIGPDSLPAHAHGDILSFEWSVAGQRLIVDPGVYEYIDGPKRSASRSAASHNTLCFEGQDQADFFGAFRCGRRPNVEVRAFEAGPDKLILEGTHDGFSQPHVRRFEATAAVLAITDRIEGRATRPARIGFLLHPEVRVEVGGQDIRLSRGAACVKMSANAKIDVEDGVWWPDMGYEQRTKRLVVTVAPGIAEVVTTFSQEAS